MSKTRLARIAIPVALILIWLVGAAVGGPYFGRIEEVATNDQSTFLPTSAEATVVGEVDTFTAPVLRASLDTQLEQQPTALVIDLCGVQFLGSAGLAVLVETQKSARSRDVGLRLVANTRAVTRPLEVTGLIDLFTIAEKA